MAAASRTGDQAAQQEDRTRERERDHTGVYCYRIPSRSDHVAERWRQDSHLHAQVQVTQNNTSLSQYGLVSYSVTLPVSIDLCNSYISVRTMVLNHFFFCLWSISVLRTAVAPLLTIKLIKESG